SVWPLGNPGTLYAHLFDQGGNWIGTRSADWTWQGTIPGNAYGLIAGLENPLSLGSFVSTVVGQTQVTFDPQSIIETDSGDLTITVTESGTPYVHNVDLVSVSGNTADHFDIVPEVAGNWDAVTCYSVTVRAKDSGGADAPYYDGTKT